MKRLVALATILLVLTLAAVALAAGGLGKFETKITGKGPRTEKGMLDGTWTIDLKSPTSGKLNLSRNGQEAGGGTYVISGSTITLTPKKHGVCTTKGAPRAAKATPRERSSCFAKPTSSRRAGRFRRTTWRSPTSSQT